jgi:putative membrane protein
MRVAPENEQKRVLVLCVDRDGDLGAKAEIKTPVIGREGNLNAAVSLALKDPEEPDANAIFASVREYDELLAKGSECEVAIVCGDANGGFEADRRVAKEVLSVVKAAEYSGVVLVSDGGEDEQVIPIIQSMKPIVSVRRVTVKHSQTVEETYQVLGRYLRMLVFDPRYSKWALGVPGVIFILAGILIVAHQVFEAELATLLIVGGAFFIRGFNVDRTVAGLLQRGPTGYIRLFAMAMGVIVIFAGLFTGYGSIVANDPLAVNAVVTNPSLLLTYGASLAGYLIQGSLTLVWAGIAIYATGALLSHVVRDSARWRRDGYVLVLLGILYFPVNTFSAVLIGGTPQSTFLLISYALIGLAVIFAITTAVYPRVRTRGAPERE